ncbi:hypothetical protein [Nocardioides sp. B-3]|uniref:hypothetical protein n=1 Tax=Nocardioides sp. B-3 TaxID=2895565 RepID=UPI002152C588|nr:hypothetical protein [Nocardioides sp. B-3]UUZ61512.1 hypothetical protein LP418_13705 [Nocardioides sp. B-3]
MLCAVSAAAFFLSFFAFFSSFFAFLSSFAALRGGAVPAAFFSFFAFLVSFLAFWIAALACASSTAGAAFAALTAATPSGVVVSTRLPAPPAGIFAVPEPRAVVAFAAMRALTRGTMSPQLRKAAVAVRLVSIGPVGRLLVSGTVNVAGSGENAPAVPGVATTPVVPSNGSTASDLHCAAADVLVAQVVHEGGAVEDPVAPGRRSSGRASWSRRA